jgi:16S rRNA (uracil1498-N3)-methyltransferase
MHPLFFGQVNSGGAALSLPDRQHAGRVLRLRAGQLIVLCNGQGKAWEAELLPNFAQTGELKILRELPAQAKPGFWLGIGMLHKADRMEWLAEKAVELGIQGLIPLRSERAQAFRYNPERLQKIMEAAMKQSQRYWLPKLLPPLSIAELCQQEWPAHRRFAYCGETNHPPEEWPEMPAEGIGLIGPEGDFSPAEIDLLRENKFKPIALSAFRLRSETAALTLLGKWNQAEGLDRIGMINPLL